MSNKKSQPINEKKKNTSPSENISTQNASTIDVFNAKPKSPQSQINTSNRKKTTSKKKSAKKKKTAPKRNPTLHKFFTFLEKNFTPTTIVVVTALILIGFFLIGAICGFKLHKSLQKQSRVNSIDAYIEKSSAEFNVPYDVIYAVIETESSFDPDAVSPTGARGLMQINKITLEDINQRLNTHYSFDDLFDPEINIKLGAFYLSYLIDRFENYETVYAAYNAGPTQVSKWLHDSAYSSDGKTLIHDSIPFPETKRYVEKVIAFRENYLAEQE